MAVLSFFLDIEEGGMWVREFRYKLTALICSPEDNYAASFYFGEISKSDWIGLRGYQEVAKKKYYTKLIDRIQFQTFREEFRAIFDYL